MRDLNSAASNASDSSRNTGDRGASEDHSDSTGDTKPGKAPRPDKRMFGRYELLMEVAKGGMAALYLARIRGPAQFEKLVAIKRIYDHYSEEERFTEMFLDEARLSAMIHHPNVANVHDMGEVDGSYFIAMEYVHGESYNAMLRAASRQPKVMARHHAVRIVAEAAAGLHAAHELTDGKGKNLGVVHRDVSPQNILVGYDGQVKVIDFGIAYAAERLTKTATGTLKGKAAYMSPEQLLLEPVDRRSDVFSLGIVLWESVLMRRLFKEESDAATMLRIRDGDIPDPRSIRPDLPYGLERIIMKALAYKPKDRYQTCAELEEALNRELMRLEEFVTRQQLSDVMKQLFFDKMRIRDEQIQLALSGEPNDVPVAVGMGSSAAQSSETLSIHGPTDTIVYHGRRRLTIIAAVAVAAALLIAFFVVRGMGNEGTMTTPPADTEANVAAPPTMKTQQDPPPEVSPRRRSTTTIEPRPRPSATVQIRLRVKPRASKPRVSFGGKTYKGNKLRMTIQRANRTATMFIRAKGYQDREVLVSQAHHIDFEITLKPAEAPAAMRRTVMRRWPKSRWRPMKPKDPADFVLVP